MKRANIIISGRVQHVYFRAFAEDNANMLGLKGWVQNLDNDKLEIIIEGEDKNISELIRKLRKGPTGARVDNININYEQPTGEFKDFKIIR